MQSLKEFYKQGNGPSSSHTMGPKKAAEMFKKEYKDADFFEVILYGSLAATGKGHLTDYIIEQTLKPIKVNIIFDKKTKCDVHPNTMVFVAYKQDREIGRWMVYSIGGGTIKIDGLEDEEPKEVYYLNTFSEISEYCEKNNKKIYDYVYETEGENIKEFLADIWKAMKASINYGLEAEGTIPGKLNLKKRAKSIYSNINNNETEEIKRTRLLTAYAYAVSETNASGGEIVTAPTCGSCGVLPSALYYLQASNNYTDEEIINALATAGIIGNIVKTNASISGAECGGQAEIGTACSMAAAAASQLKKLDIYKIEHAAEIAMEHHMGLTCDPIYGYVQIPCIERNAVAAIRAIDASNISMLLDETQKISFDLIVDTMYETGKDLRSHYRETSTGGLAKKYCRNKYYNADMQ